MKSADGILYALSLLCFLIATIVALVEAPKQKLVFAGIAAGLFLWLVVSALKVWGVV